MPKKPYEVGGADYDLLWELINRVPSKMDTGMVSAMAWYFRLFQEIGADGMTAAHMNAWVSLFARMARLCHYEPAFDGDDWADALVHFPVEIRPEDVLALDDDAIVRFLDAAARFKRETYCDMPHELSAEEVAAMSRRAEPDVPVRKAVAVVASDGEVMDVLDVVNWDSGFADVLDRLEQDWQKTDEEYSDFVYPRLRRKGYDFRVIDVVKYSARL